MHLNILCFFSAELINSINETYTGKPIMLVYLVVCFNANSDGYKLSPAKIVSKKLRLLIKSDWFGSVQFR